MRITSSFAVRMAICVGTPIFYGLGCAGISHIDSDEITYKLFVKGNFVPWYVRTHRDQWPVDLSEAVLQLQSHQEIPYNRKILAIHKRLVPNLRKVSESNNGDTVTYELAFAHGAGPIVIELEKGSTRANFGEDWP